VSHIEISPPHTTTCSGPGGPIAGQHSVLRTIFAWIHLALGETDDPFIWIERAMDSCDPMMGPIKTCPFPDPLRDDPRFIALLRKGNLST
jgi:hypothetical protein